MRSVLADRKLAKSGGQINELLTACWEEPLDAGPYTLPEGGKLDRGKVLQGDRFFALLMVRALTYGPEYVFGVSCRNDLCRARNEREIDLTKLPVRRLAEESRTAFIAGNRFETTLPDAGKRVAHPAAGGGTPSASRDRLAPPHRPAGAGAPLLLPHPRSGLRRGAAQGGRLRDAVRSHWRRR